MRKRTLLALFVIAGALCLVVVAPATAGPNNNSQNGSKGYVTDFNGGTCLPLEQNKIAQGSTIYVDLVMPGDEAQGLDFYIYQQGTSANSTLVNSFIDLTPTDCGTSGNLWYVTLDQLELAPGTYTLVVNYHSTGKNFSSDSFQIVAAAG